MKNYGFWDRALIFLFAVLSMALAVVTALRVFDVDCVGAFLDGLPASPGILWKLIICGIGAILVLLGVYAIAAITPARARKSDFITLDAGDGNHVRIAIAAIRDMAKQSVTNISGLDFIDIDVDGEGDSISVSMTMNVLGSAHVPALTSEIQRTVKKYIEEKCGVAVRGVLVTVNSVLGAEDGINDRAASDNDIFEQRDIYAQPEAPRDTPEIKLDLGSPEETDESNEEETKE